MPGDAVRALYERRVDAHPVMLLKVRGLRIVRGESERRHIEDTTGHELP